MKISAVYLRLIADQLDKLSKISGVVEEIRIGNMVCKLARFEDQRDGVTYYLVNVIGND